MSEIQLTSGVRIDLERTPRDRRRAVLFDLITERKHTSVVVYVGDLCHPDPVLVDPLVEALVMTGIFLHIEGTPAAREAWHDVVRAEARARCDVWIGR